MGRVGQGRLRIDGEGGGGCYCIKSLYLRPIPWGGKGGGT